jgi:hypothetical protein
MKAFYDTISVGRYSELITESLAMSEFVAQKGFLSAEPAPLGPVTFDYMDFYNYECLKIACAFELHLKARLLGRDYIVHEI